MKGTCVTGWTPLFQQIIASSIWDAPNHIRIAWVTLLAICDREGVAAVTASGLARLAKITREQADDALKVLSEPDPDTLTQANEGRRIARVEAGWKLLNFQHYREKAKKAIVREQNREAQAVYRENREEKAAGKVPCGVPGVLALHVGFMELWSEWLEHLGQKRKKPTAIAVKRQLAKLEAMGAERAMAALSHSIGNSYTGIFEPQSNGNNGKNNGNGVAQPELPSTNVQSILHQKELERVEERIRQIRAGYDSHQSMDFKDSNEMAGLKARRTELKSLLGWMV